MTANGSKALEIFLSDADAFVGDLSLDCFVLSSDSRVLQTSRPLFPGITTSKSRGQGPQPQL